MNKKYNCPYCNYRADRITLIQHIDKLHSDMLPEGYSSSRSVYDLINHIKDGCGHCRVCHKPTKWNEVSCKYDILCDNPKCKEALRELYKRNMLRVRGTYNILNDPEQQKRMLAHRRISGSYKHSDGGIIQYTGEYERKFLEFIDNFLNIPSKDIISPGPTIEYTYAGQKHFYLPDFYYLPFNLIIEIKDGGDNINMKDSPSMRASREKTLEKERIITDKGEFNYLRLTNNAFEQLIDVFMQIKDKLMRGEDARTIRINEAANEDDFSKNTKYPNVMYFSSPKRINSLKGRVFLSPYVGISSIFCIDRKQVLTIVSGSSKPQYTNINLEYDEWKYPKDKLSEPFDIVHITHNNKDWTKPCKGSSSGYIHIVNVSRVKDKLQTVSTNSDNNDLEYMYIGEEALPIMKVVPYNIKWEIRYDKENEYRHGKPILLQKFTKESSLDYDEEITPSSEESETIDSNNTTDTVDDNMSDRIAMDDISTTSDENFV